MRDTIIIINSFLHDVATGVWVALLIVMYVISGRVAGINSTPQGAAFVAGIMDSLWFTAVVSLAGRNMESGLLMMWTRLKNRCSSILGGNLCGMH